jgi:dihydrofolate reductase
MTLNVRRIPIVMVAAVGRNGAIGASDTLPWRLRADLRRYRDITMGKPMIMGRKTFASIGRPLPGRATIVLTRDPDFVADGVFVAHDVDMALRLGAERAAAMGANEIIVAGGGEVYRLLIGDADTLRITEVDLAPKADAYFPEIDLDLWTVARREANPAGPDDEAAFTFVDYVRRERDTSLD